ncbi:MAG: flagellar biogenesis protein [Treponema sp.]|nr:flagellar biogenesis protein [Treponema sp.]
MNLQEAVALLYPETSDAPIIVAKEKGVLAQRMIELAKEFNVPVIKNSDTTDILSFYNIGDYIPEETFEIIAKIFSYIRRAL